PQFLGQELGHNNPGQQNLNEQAIVKILTCPSADHSVDLTDAAGGTGYWGDYTYNDNLGDIAINAAAPRTVNTPYEKVSQVPGNVIVATDMIKTFEITSGGASWRTSTFLQMNYLLGNHNAPPWAYNTCPDIWFPHTKNSQTNVLFMDGHISLVSPNDFI